MVSWTEYMTRQKESLMTGELRRQQHWCPQMFVHTTTTTTQPSHLPQPSEPRASRLEPRTAATTVLGSDLERVSVFQTWFEAVCWTSAFNSPAPPLPPPPPRHTTASVTCCSGTTIAFIIFLFLYLVFFPFDWCFLFCFAFLFRSCSFFFFYHHLSLSLFFLLFLSQDPRFSHLTAPTAAALSLASSLVFCLVFSSLIRHVDFVLSASLFCSFFSFFNRCIFFCCWRTCTTVRKYTARFVAEGNSSNLSRGYQVYGRKGQEKGGGGCPHIPRRRPSNHCETKDRPLQTQMSHLYLIPYRSRFCGGTSPMTREHLL